MKQYKFYLIILLSSFLIAGVIYLLFTKLNQKNIQIKTQLSNNSQINTSYPINSNVSSIISNVNELTIKYISIPLQQPRPDIINPFQKDITNFNSQMTLLKNPIINKIDKSRAIITSDNFAIMIYGIAEGSPSNGIITSDNLKVNNNLNKVIYRINYTNDQDTKSLLDSYNLNYLYRFYYTDKYDISCSGQFTKNQYCGSNYLSFKVNSKVYEPQFSIYCAVNDKIYLRYCDEFINNLIVN